MADDTEKLTRGSVRSSIKPTSGVVLAYTTLAVFTTNDESVLPRRFDYTVNPNSQVLPYPEPAVISGFCTEMDRRALNQSSGGILAFLVPPVFTSEGIPAPRVPLPVLSDIDTAQIIVRGGAFALAFTGSPRNGLPPHEVDFINNSQSPVDSWTWLFGDGDTSNEKNPSHIYLDDDNYDVTLIAGSSIFGFARLTKSEYIIVGVRVIIDPLTGKAPLTVRFRFDKVQLG